MDNDLSVSQNVYVGQYSELLAMEVANNISRSNVWVVLSNRLLVKFIHIILKTFFLIITAAEGCVFGRRASYSVVPNLDNYHDGKDNIKIGEEHEILERIKYMKLNCQEYNLLKNNCEHLATYIRYGEQCVEQVSAKFHIIPILHA